MNNSGKRKRKKKNLEKRRKRNTKRKLASSLDRIMMILSSRREMLRLSKALKMKNWKINMKK